MLMKLLRYYNQWIINRILKLQIFLHLYSSTCSILVEIVNVVVDEDINRVID